MILPQFAQVGWQIRRLPLRPKSVQVFGERASGTNYVQRLVQRNTGLAAADLGWKHGFAQMVAIPPEVLIIGVVRNAPDWALSMHRRPWHCPPDMQCLPFDAFLRSPWRSIADRKRYFPGLPEGAMGQPLQWDRDPITGGTYAHLPALRRAKLAGLLGFANRRCQFALCRLEAVQSDPEGFLNALGVGLNAEFKSINKRLGQRFKASVEDRPDTPDALGPADLSFLCAGLDLETEAALGYRYT